MSPAPFRPLRRGPVRRGPVRAPVYRPHGSGPTLRALGLAVVGLLAALLALLLAPVVAGAHGGPGNLALVSFDPATGQPAGGADYQISVKLTFAGDGDPVDDATVTLSATSDTGGRLTPVTLTSAGGGAFSGKFALPSTGSWNLTVVSVEPPAQLALEPVTVTTTGSPGTGGSNTGGSDTGGSSTSAPSGGAATTEGKVSALEGAGTTGASTPDSLGASPTVAPGARNDDGSDMPWPLLLGAAVVLGLLLLFGVRRYLTTRRDTALAADRDGGRGTAPGVGEGAGGDGGTDGGGDLPV